MQRPPTVLLGEGLPRHIDPAWKRNNIFLQETAVPAMANIRNLFLQSWSSAASTSMEKR